MSSLAKSKNPSHGSLVRSRDEMTDDASMMHSGVKQAFHEISGIQRSVIRALCTCSGGEPVGAGTGICIVFV